MASPVWPSCSDFAWRDGERLIRFGPGALAEAPALLRDRGFDGYALLTTERAAGQAPALATGAGRVLHVPAGGVPEAAAAVRGAVGGRPLVAVGGGRVIDAAKAIAAADGLPCAAVPTTLAGAELTRLHRLPAGVRDAPLVRPSLVVACPGLMTSQPRPGLAASAINALAHAVEPLYVVGGNPVGALVGLDAAARIARGELALGALLGAYALDAAGYALHHVLCQTIVRRCGTPHAATNAVCLPHVVALMAPRAPAAIGALAAALGARTADPAAAAGRVTALAAPAGVGSLRELGVSPGDAAGIVAGVEARAELARTPDPPGAAELRSLVLAAIDGPRPT